MPVTRICRLWTVGHSTRTADHFLELLRAHEIDRLADIRTIPQSRRHPHFGRLALEARLKEAGIEYRHFHGLGGLRKPRPDSPNSAWRNPAFRGYADHMLSPEFASAVDELLIFGDEGRAAVMCAEAVWWRCHRMLLSDALVGRGVDVQHILTEASTQPHRLTPFARLQETGQISYPSPLLVDGL
jgi:uncharacterized protein (DUF488 family)